MRHGTANARPPILAPARLLQVVARDPASEPDSRPDITRLQSTCFIPFCLLVVHAALMHHLHHLHPLVLKGVTHWQLPGTGSVAAHLRQVAKKREVGVDIAPVFGQLLQQLFQRKLVPHQQVRAVCLVQHQEPRAPEGPVLPRLLLGSQQD
jgi:hypothetical protein